MADADRSRTALLARALCTERERAEQYLWAEMAKLGLRKEDGWSIHESTREQGGGTQIVLRPIHRQLRAPEGLECIVGIGADDGGIQRECTPADR